MKLINAAYILKTSNNYNMFIEFFGTSLIIYKIIIIAIPIIIFLLYIKSCKISNKLEHLTKEQEYTNEFLIKQIEQNERIIELLKNKTE